MEKIVITYTGEPGGWLSKQGGWLVRQGDKTSGELTYEEMLGVVVSLTASADKGYAIGKMQGWMKTDAEREKIRADFDIAAKAAAEFFNPNS